jgi:hypothetical protein
MPNKLIEAQSKGRCNPDLWDCYQFGLFAELREQVIEWEFGHLLGGRRR